MKTLWQRYVARYNSLPMWLQVGIVIVLTFIVILIFCHETL